MAYVSVSEWRPEQVTEWLKGLDNSVVPYLHWFSNNEVNGQQLLNLSPDELTHLGVQKLGHQELILEAVQHLRNFHYELDRENLQLLALRLSCAAHSLYNEIKNQAESSSVSTQIMADVANVVNTVKPLVSWLDRPPFLGQSDYAEFKKDLLSLSLAMATCAQRDRFAERPVSEIRHSSSELAALADKIIQDIPDPMLLQPATLDLATIKKRVGEDLGFFLVPSFHGVHQIGDMKLSSAAHQSGKIQQGDEIVQVNYQTVVGWARKKVLALFEESPNDLLLTLKRRPRHVKIYGQIYVKPYRLPSRKRASPYSRWNDNLPSPRPELLTIPHFQMPRAIVPEKKLEVFAEATLMEQSASSSSSDEDFEQPLESQSPTSMRLYLPKPRPPIQRRYTLSGPPRPSAQSEQFWRELQLERSWRSSQNNSELNPSDCKSKTPVEDMFQLRDKSASFGNAISGGPRAGSDKAAVRFDNGIKPEREADKVVRSDVKLSIVELNKLKREAFFNNMDVSNAAVENRFTRSKEDKGKVSRLIDDFERRTELQVDEGKAVRGRLDKSCSTPAYDLSDTEPEPEWKATRRRSDREAHGQMVNTINDHLLPDGDLYGKIACKEEPHRGEILETVNLALVELKDRETRDAEPRKPVPAQRKSLCPSPGPLPPKPRPRPLPPSPELPKPPLRSVTPPEPPPRPLPHSPSAPLPTVALEQQPERPPPPPPVLSVVTERDKPRQGGGTLDSLRAMLTLGRKPLSFSSPRSARKKNALLAKRRHVSARDVSPCGSCGMLGHRNRKGCGAAWTRAYFVLQGSSFYGFKSRDSNKADLFIHLPGFTCTSAEEVKSRPFAFKIYHTGTVFYFSADSEEDMQQWVESVALATVGLDDRPSAATVTFSETDSDGSDTEPELETCFPTSPKMKKFLGGPAPKPARSHQNLASESKSYEIQKKFSSLKKFSSSRQHGSSSGGGERDSRLQSSDVASLDRKYLGFLGHKNNPVPVPTSQFRSYRRMNHTTPPQGKTNVKVNNTEVREVAARSSREAPRLTRRTLHSSNPSLIHPDMADYRVTQERLAEFRRIRNQDRPVDLSGFMTLEQFMLARQEEERLMRCTAASRTQSEPLRSDSGRNRARQAVYPSCSSVGRSVPPPRPPTDAAPSRKKDSEPPQVAPRAPAPPAKQKLKNAALYQPPPIPHSPAHSSQQDEAMSFAFEMTLDQNGTRRGAGAEEEAAMDLNGASAEGCCLNKDATPDYPGLEYPPAFEPETYTLQYMLKNRRRREARNN